MDTTGSMDDQWENFSGSYYDQLNHDWCWYNFYEGKWYTNDNNSETGLWEECTEQDHPEHVSWGVR